MDRVVALHSGLSNTGIEPDDRWSPPVSREPSELRLVWPADLFAREAQYLLDTRRLDDETLGWLVEEAFHGPGGRRWLSQIPYPSSPTLAAEGLAAVMAAAAPAARSRLLADLLKTLETIPPYERLQLWSERHRRSTGPGPFDQPPRPEDRQEDLRTDIAFVLNDLDVHGYFALEFSTTATGSCQASDGAHWLGQQLRLDPHDPDSPPLWPLFDQYGFAARWWVTCSCELLFDVIEALHSAVARPRRRRERENGERTYSDHARGPGQDLYRWRINEVLARHDERWRIAGDGPERGRLVEVTGDPRDDLVQLLMTPAAARESTDADDGTSDRDRPSVAHAVELFRARDATRETKRSAVVAVARVLENRRSLLKGVLLSQDEGALFQVANQFDVRHANDRQRDDYAEEFLDWIFWWYLATVELTDRILAQRTATVAPTT